MYATNTAKPAAIVRLETRNADASVKRQRETEARRAAYRRNAARYNAVTFWREARDLSDFFKPRQFDHDTLQDAENDCMDSVDHSYLFAREYARDIVKEYGDDARDLFRYLAPAAPFERYRDRVAADLVRAVADARRADYALQFFDYCRDAVERAANETGMEWTWLDAAGNPTDQEYDARRVGFACSRRAYLNRNAEWWPVTHWRGHGEPHDAWNDYASNRERLDAADDVLGDYLTETLESERADLEHFDERGSRYGDDDYWPECFSDYSEAVEAFREDDGRMRERLRAMIRNRAPLEDRAALVASVYGVAGMEESDDE